LFYKFLSSTAFKKQDFNGFATTVAVVAFTFMQRFKAGIYCVIVTAAAAAFLRYALLQ
jgi:hypothetical protein